MTPIPAVSVLAMRGDNVLLIKRGKSPYENLWSLPGGLIQLGETALDAAARELREETGLLASRFNLGDIHDVIIRSGNGEIEAHYVIIVFVVCHVSGVATAADDALEVKWIARPDIGKIASTPGLEALVARLAQRREHEE